MDEREMSGTLWGPFTLTAENINILVGGNSLGVYVLGSESTIQYVGHSEKLINRLHQHKQKRKYA